MPRVAAQKVPPEQITSIPEEGTLRLPRLPEAHLQTPR